MAGVTPLDIWTALRQQGASPVQAAGIMGNMIHESTLDPEAAAIDSNGAWSYGLIQWNTANGAHPQAPGLVTGNPVSDLKAQVSYLISTGGLAAAAGSTPADAGANFAHTYERCAACGYQGGSSELAVRAASANAVYAAQQSGNWSGITAGVAPAPYTIVGANPNETAKQADPSAIGHTGAGVGCHAQDSGGTNCIINLPGSFCITRCELKAVKGALILVAGGALFMVGGLIIAAYGLKASGLSKAAGQAAQPVRKVAQTVPPSARVLSSATRQARAPAKARRSEGRELRGSLARGEVSYPRRETPFDEGDQLFERSRGSRASNRAFYRRTMSDTSDMQRRTA